MAIDYGVPVEVDVTELTADPGNRGPNYHFHEPTGNVYKVGDEFTKLINEAKAKAKTKLKGVKLKEETVEGSSEENETDGSESP